MKVVTGSLLFFFMRHVTRTCFRVRRRACHFYSLPSMPSRRRSVSRSRLSRLLYKFHLHLLLFNCSWSLPPPASLILIDPLTSDHTSSSPSWTAFQSSSPHPIPSKTPSSCLPRTLGATVRMGVEGQPTQAVVLSTFFAPAANIHETNESAETNGNAATPRFLTS